jgi:hypothetical protein
MVPRRLVLLSALVLTATACVYIDKKTNQDKLTSLDQDNDGSKYFDDCDDLDGTRSPEFAEIKDNGIDDDCLPKNGPKELMDEDGDGYPVETHDDWLAAHPNPIPSADIWPELAHPDIADCDDDPVTGPNVFPDATDVAYDGVDADCAGDDDYDFDDDGYVRDQDADKSSLPAGDCDDIRSDIHPGAEGDEWYDGIDTNCDGVNDFDQDGDGFMPDVVPVYDLDGNYTGSTRLDHNDFAAYCVRYGFATGPTDLASCWEHFTGVAEEPVYGDCADFAEQLPPWASGVFGTGAVYPGASPDVPYDGIDIDCNQQNEYDVDGDGYIADRDVLDFGDYVSFYQLALDPINGYAFEDVLSGECDDTDPLVRPGIMEILGDNTDQDCDGGVETTAWLDGGFTGWSNPRPPVVGRNNINYILGTIADTTSAVSFQQAGVALAFDPAASHEETPDALSPWHNNSSQPNPTGFALDMLVQDDGFYPATQYWSTTSGGSGYFISKEYAWTGTTYLAKIQYEVFKPEDYYNDVDIVYSEAQGEYWTLGCGALTFTFIDDYYSTASPPLWSKRGGVCANSDGSSPCTDVDYPGGVTCFVEPPATGGIGLGTICDGTTCITYELDVTTLTGDIRVAATQPYAGKTWTQVNQTADWRTADEADGMSMYDGSNSYTVLTGKTVRGGEAIDAGGLTYVAAVVSDQDNDAIDDVVIAYGDPATSLTEIAVPFRVEGIVYQPTDASIYADSDRVFVGVSGVSTSGGDDMVAWVFLGPVGAVPFEP